MKLEIQKVSFVKQNKNGEGWSHVTLMQNCKGGFTLWFAMESG